MLILSASDVCACAHVCLWPSEYISRCFGEGVVFNCCFIVRLYLTFSDTTAIWICTVYFCNIDLTSSFDKEPVHIT